MRKHNQSSSSTLWIHGIHAVVAALKNPQRQQQRLLIKDSKILDKISISHLSVQAEIVDKSVFDTMLGHDVVHQGIALKTNALPVLALEDMIATLNNTALIVILDSITDPHNTGAILRSAAAFGASAVITTIYNSSAIDSGVLAKTASGSLEHVPIIEVTNLARTMDVLKKSNFWIYGLDEMGQQTINSFSLGNRTALVLGAEGSGLRRLTKELCDDLVKLPTSLKFSTLNVSASAAVAIYEWHRQNHTVLKGNAL